MTTYKPGVDVFGVIAPVAALIVSPAVEVYVPPGEPVRVTFALAAFGGPHGQYLVHTIILGTPGMEFHKVIVDPGTGQVLDSQEMSAKEWMKMQQMHQMMHGSGGGPGGGGMMMMGDRGMMKSDHGWK